jgi:hypothetical protein
MQVTNLTSSPSRRAWLAFSALFCIVSTGLAFPPSPHHVIFGVVRDQLGRPLTITNATVIFENSSGLQVKSPIVPNLRPGTNYRLSVPMDFGVPGDIYKNIAQKPGVPFRVKVRIGSQLYTPIEMTGDFASLGDPAAKTRINLTLGADSDSDGLPDAWESLVSDLMGGTLGLQDIKPGLDLGGFGMTLYEDFIAGTFPSDPNATLRVTFSGYHNGSPRLDFNTIRGRTYSLLASLDLQTWAPIQFRVAADPENSVRSYYAPTNSVSAQVEVVQSSESASFFKIQVD